MYLLFVTENRQLVNTIDVGSIVLSTLFSKKEMRLVFKDQTSYQILIL